QGIRNQTLRQAYLANQQRSTRKQRDVKKGIRVAALLRQPTKASIGAKQGRIPLYGAHSSAMGQLVKSF
ncbi:hypothetical protein JOD18_003230, partial [Gracilibacillus alcaliphilus]|nr:hypothetical protein [Gracilibacillus alcaliphilus]